MVPKNLNVTLILSTLSAISFSVNLFQIFMGLFISYIVHNNLTLFSFQMYTVQILYYTIKFLVIINSM